MEIETTKKEDGNNNESELNHRARATGPVASYLT